MLTRPVLFDAYGTLFDVRALDDPCEAFFPGFGSELSARWRATQLQYTWLRSLMGRYVDFWSVTEDALVVAGRRLGLDVNAERHAALMDAYRALPAFPDVAPALRELRRLPLGILSNGTAEMLNAVIDHAGLAEAFSSVISADEARTYKPSPLVYGLGTVRLGLPASAIAFVSSNAWDVAGARAFGYWTCWLNRTGDSPEVLGLDADAVAGSLLEVAGLLA